MLNGSCTLYFFVHMIPVLKGSDKNGLSASKSIWISRLKEFFIRINPLHCRMN